MKDLIKTIYDVGIIDYWQDWECIFKETESPLGLRTIKPITTKEFGVIMDFIYKLSQTSWEGDIRGGDEIYMRMDNGYEFMVGLKQDNNGTTYVGVIRDTDIDYLKEICFEGCDFTPEQVYPNIKDF